MNRHPGGSRLDSVLELAWLSQLSNTCNSPWMLAIWHLSHTIPPTSVGSKPCCCPYWADLTTQHRLCKLCILNLLLSVLEKGFYQLPPMPTGTMSLGGTLGIWEGPLLTSLVDRLTWILFMSSHQWPFNYEYITCSSYFSRPQNCSLKIAHAQPIFTDKHK